MRITSLAGRPIEQYTSPNVGGRMTGHRGIVLHIAQGTYRGTIAWILNPDQRYKDGTRVTTSSTWLIGREPGEWAQMVDTDTVAWCQRKGSYDWLSIELAGWAPAAPSGWQIEACAQLLAWAHRAYGVPLRVAPDPSVTGLGHHSMDREWLGEEWGHEACPGTGVIAAKAAIVTRALAIEAGEDEDMDLGDKIGLPAMTWPAGMAPAVAGDGSLALPDEPGMTVRAALAYGQRYASAATRYAQANWAQLRVLAAEVTALRAVIEQLARLPSADGRGIDVPTLLAGVDERLAALRAQLDADRRDALGDLAEAGAGGVREGVPA